jgi:competence protein ComEC
MVYGDTAFLFAGDAEGDSENAMLAGGDNIRASVLKAGHHGSSTATTDAFLDRVRPDAVVISCGTGNSYGHPHAEILEKLAGREILVYRTDLSGNIPMVTDGKEIGVYANP